MLIYKYNIYKLYIYIYIYIDTSFTQAFILMSNLSHNYSYPIIKHLW